MPETRAVRRLQHSAKATAQSFHSSRPISVINLPPQVVVTVYSLMKGRWGALSEYLRLFGAQCGQGLSCMISQGLLRSWFSTASMPYDESGGLADFCSSAVDTDSYAASLVMSDGESVYDYCWYPYMSSSSPETCVFASTTCDHPIYLWDATTGQLRCTYRVYDAMDEITAAFSTGFSPAGTK